MSTARTSNDASKFPGLRYGELVERRAARQPDDVAFIHDGNRITYGEFSNRVHAAAAFLAEQGIRPGDRVVCFAENSPEVFTALYACSRIGAVFIPVGVTATAADVRYILDDLSVRAVLVSSRASAVAAEVVGTDGIRVIRLQPDPDSRQPALPLSGDGPAPEVRPEPDTPALVVYTSGTSGRPKGVVLTHGALFFNGVNTLLGLDILSDDVTLVNTPLSHIAALNTLAASTLQKGGTVVVESKFDPERCLQQIGQYGITTMFAVPSMLTMMARTGGFAGADISSLRFVLGGGAPMPRELVTLWSERGVPVITSYGMTEAGPSVSFRRRSDVLVKPESSGKPALLTDVHIVAADGRSAAPGEVGQIFVRGPHIATGYWRNDSATEATFRDGWLDTGDRGRVDADGDIHITGRTKEIIITGGENVDPSEVEHLISRYPGIVDAAVVGRPDPVWGEVVTAVVVSEVDVELDDLQNFLRPHLAPFKLPRRLEQRERLPRNPVGKLLRRELHGLPQGR